MTLEQIKTEQKSINKELLNNLDNLREVVVKIVGNWDEGDNKQEPQPIPNGLIQEIRFSQLETSDISTEINKLINRLSDNTYNLVKVEQD